MTIALDSLTPCFQGLIPATLYTCSKAGIPNVAYLSHVDYVDSGHVALSHQFFNKSRANITENPQALIRISDPDTMQCYELRLLYVRSETSGPLFDSMALRIEAIASHSGLKGIFKLIAADIYEVLSVEKAVDEVGVCRAATCNEMGAHEAPAFFSMKALQEISDRIRESRNLEVLLDSILASLEASFGFDHSMILLAGEGEGKLVTIASRGYPVSGVGSEVGFGEGLIGMVAEARKPIRISGLLRDMLYAEAVRKRAEEEGVCPPNRLIPLPGLPQPESQLGIPLIVRDELVGVLCIESGSAYRFHEEDKAFVEVLGSYLALAIQNELLHERAEEHVDEPVESIRAGNGRGRKSTKSREISYFRSDECILVDGEYLIRSLPAKLLWKILNEHEREGRTEFRNRSLRLDKSLQLPAFRDNLESRLLLLRRRLEQRCPEIRLVPYARGRFALALDCEIVLKEKP